MFETIKNLLSGEDKDLLSFESQTFDRNLFNFPSPNIVNDVYSDSDRSNRVLRNLQSIYSQGRLNNTGYLSILPVDQGVEHSAGARFSKNPQYFDPTNIVELALQAECSAVVSTLGVLGMVARKYAHTIPFIVKINHNQLLTYPVQYKQVMFANVEQAYNLGATGIGATVYFGSPESNDQIIEVSKAFARAHELGMFTVLWCYTRNSNFKVNGIDYSTSADITGQANHLGVTIEADIIKQKLPTNSNGFQKIYSDKENSSGQSQYGGGNNEIYSKLTTDNPIDLTRYQLANCYMGKIPLLNSGNASGQNDIQEATKAAIINKRAGGSGLIMGRKAFEKPMDEGVEILKAVQNVYLCKEVTVA